ncbi:uncharacterized protein LOC132162954 [Corylus avellana]|uniref:uncharacterized protein LOC132162954 n=1 Tax=Corylus avellana TaxID=13451 RepID=UPI00286BE428|nr:uncharacterized protein LOC132162954 [Corylus avellana]
MPSTYSTQSPVRLLDLDANVNQFIDEATRWWNIPLIQKVLTRDEAVMVCSIPICPGCQQDRRVWIGMNNGDFSVKSAYHLAKTVSEAKQGSYSDYTLRSKQWNAIWQIKGAGDAKGAFEGRWAPASGSHCMTYMVAKEQQPNLVVQRWKKPPFGVVKFNWDAAVDKERERMGIGIIVRDHNGLILAAYVASRQYITDPTTTKALVAWKMVELCVCMEFQNVILEGDSLEVIQALRKEECSWGRCGTLINDTKLLLQNVDQWSFCHVKSTGNVAAYRLAKLAISLNEERL